MHEGAHTLKNAWSKSNDVVVVFNHVVVANHAPTTYVVKMTPYVVVIGNNHAIRNNHVIPGI